MNKLRYTVKRGKAAGTVLTPHLHEGGHFVVSKTRFKVDYIYERDEARLVEWIAKGYSVRMSKPDSKTHRSPSLISPGSIKQHAA